MAANTSGSNNSGAIPKKQLKIDEIFQEQNNNVKLKNLMFNWLIDSGLSFSIADDRFFYEIMGTTNSRVKLPSAKYLRRSLMPQVYGKVKGELRHILAEQMIACSVTTDLYELTRKDKYLAITAHFVHRDTWERKSGVLGCLPSIDDWEAEGVADVLKALFSYFIPANKLHFIQTINVKSNNLVDAIELIGLKNTGSFLHKLHDVVTNCLNCQKSVAELNKKVRHIIDVIQRKTKPSQLFEKVQEDEHLPEHLLIVDHDSPCFNTYYRMLQRFVEQKKAVEFVCRNADELTDYVLDQNEWDLLLNLENFSRIVDGRDYGCISGQLPQIKYLLRQLSCDAFPTFMAFKDELIAAIQKCAYGGGSQPNAESIEENKFYMLATLLDSRFKKKGFRSEELADRAELELVQVLRDEILASTDASSVTGEQDSSLCLPDVKTALEETLPVKKELTEFDPSSLAYEQAKSMISNYLNEPEIAFDDSPLLFWKVNSSKFPPLAKLALTYLSSPLSSKDVVDVESDYYGVHFAREDFEPYDYLMHSKYVQRRLFLMHNRSSIGCGGCDGYTSQPGDNEVVVSSDYSDRDSDD